MNDQRTIELIALLGLNPTELNKEVITFLHGYRNEAASLRGLCEDAIEYAAGDKQGRLYDEYDHINRLYG